MLSSFEAEAGLPPHVAPALLREARGAAPDGAAPGDWRANVEPRISAGDLEKV